jgi:hypothetical protein
MDQEYCLWCGKLVNTEVYYDQNGDLGQAFFCPQCGHYGLPWNDIFKLKRLRINSNEIRKIKDYIAAQPTPENGICELTMGSLKNVLGGIIY